MMILKNNPTARAEDIAKELGGITTSGIKYHLQELKEKNMIFRVGPNKGGRWEVSDKNK